MKKMITLLLITSALLTACGSSSDSGSNSKPAQTAKQVGVVKSADASSAEQTSDSTAESSQTEQTESGSDSKILVAYFTPAENGELDAVTSASKVNFWGEDMGNAEAMANVIAAYTGGDLFSIQTVKDYPVDYDDLVNDAKAEQEAGTLPELATAVDISGYDTVFMVYPVWWYTMPQPIYTFLNDYDFSGKNIIPVTTHEGSGMADSVSKLSELEPDASVGEGYSVAGGDVAGCQEDIESWLKDEGF
jgi:flavodoxin